MVGMTDLSKNKEENKNNLNESKQLDKLIKLHKLNPRSSTLVQYNGKFTGDDGKTIDLSLYNHTKHLSALSNEIVGEVGGVE
jgi:hypothetical protein